MCPALQSHSKHELFLIGAIKQLISVWTTRKNNKAALEKHMFKQEQSLWMEITILPDTYLSGPGKLTELRRVDCISYWKHLCHQIFQKYFLNMPHSSPKMQLSFLLWSHIWPTLVLSQWLWRQCCCWLQWPCWPGRKEEKCASPATCFFRCIASNL